MRVTSDFCKFTLLVSTPLSAVPFRLDDAEDTLYDRIARIVMWGIQDRRDAAA